MRLLQTKRDDAPLRARFRRERRIHASALIDAEVASAVRGLPLSGKFATQTRRPSSGRIR